MDVGKPTMPDEVELGELTTGPTNVDVAPPAPSSTLNFKNQEGCVKLSEISGTWVKNMLAATKPSFPV